jgi:hypothetical protein
MYYKMYCISRILIVTLYFDKKLKYFKIIYYNILYIKLQISLILKI